MTIGRRRALIILALTACPASAGSTYLALGDSLAWGYEKFSLDLAPNAGDQGYVSIYADHLATQNAGVRPNLVNLGVPQETSSSFFTGGQLGQLLNTNYPGQGTPSQHDLMLATIADQHALGNTIDHVTMHLGVNDFLSLADGDFLNLPPDQQFGQVLLVFDDMITNLRATLTDLTTMAPEADVMVMGYYDPFALFVDHPELDPSPTGDGVLLSGISGDIAPLLNDVLEALAGEYDATFVPIADLFAGREAELTLITELDRGSPNIHPNQLGYQTIADALIAIPAPGTGVVLAGFGVVATRRRRSSQPSARTITACGPTLSISNTSPRTSNPSRS
ncbi:MAG: GDSL-type esterase/lipase family protein [Phycisphaerales bacterium]